MVAVVKDLGMDDGSRDRRSRGGHFLPSSTEEAKDALLEYLKVHGEAINELFIGHQAINTYYLIIRHCPNVTLLSCMFGMNPVAAQALSHLRCLKKFTCASIDGPSLLAVADAAPQLETIFFMAKSGVSFSTDELTSLSRLRALRTLELCEVNFTQHPHALGALAANCRHLVDVSLWEATNEGLLALTEGCPALERLTISVQDGLSPATVAAMADHWSQLRHLTLWITQLTEWGNTLEDAAVDLLQRCRHLAHLHLVAVDDDSEASLNFPNGAGHQRTPLMVEASVAPFGVQELVVQGLRAAALRKVCIHSPLLHSYKQLLPISDEALGVLAQSSVAAIFVPAVGLQPADLAPLRDLCGLAMWSIGPQMEPALAALAVRCPLLNDLQLHFAAPPQLDTLGAIARSCPELRFLQYCSSQPGGTLEKRAAGAVKSLLQALCPRLSLIDI